MSNYIDYVYCQGVPDYQTKHLFQTNACSGLKSGDIVFADGCGVAAFTVIAVSTVEKESEFDFFIRTMCEDEEVMSLMGKMTTLQYEEEDI